MPCGIREIIGFVLCTLAFGLWTLDFGLWTLVFGLWSLAFGFWPLGLWSLAFGLSLFVFLRSEISNLKSCLQNPVPLLSPKTKKTRRLKLWAAGFGIRFSRFSVSLCQRRKH